MKPVDVERLKARWEDIEKKSAKGSAAPALLFGPDRFHPSAAGYESVARLLVPSVLERVVGRDRAERVEADHQRAAPAGIVERVPRRHGPAPGRRPG